LTDGFVIRSIGLILFNLHIPSKHEVLLNQIILSCVLYFRSEEHEKRVNNLRN